MLSRIAAIFTVLYLSSLCNFASAQKNDKTCEPCRKMATTGTSPYEFLWTLRGGIGKEFASEVLGRKMFLRIADLKQAEGIFLEYCRNFCLHTLEGKIWDKTGKSNYKKHKILHFNSLQEEEQYTKLGKKEFKRLKKKIESALGVKRTTEAKKKATTERSSTRKQSYANIYDDFMPSLNFFNRLSSSRSLQPASVENSTVDSSTLNDTMELSLRQSTNATTIAVNSSSASNTTDTTEVHTTEMSFEMTGKNTTEKMVETTTLTTPESEENTETNDDSSEKESKEKLDKSKESKNVSPKPDKSQSKDDIENVIKYLNSLISDPDFDMILKQAASVTRTIVKCMIDITMTEVERALGITPGLLVRERCGASDKQTSFESTIVNFLKDILDQYSNLQSVIPLSELILPSPVLQPPPVLQPKLPPVSKFQPNYPDLQAPPQNYNDYDGGVSQQGFSNLIPPSPIIPPPFIPQNLYFEEEPINYYDYPEPEPFISAPDLTWQSSQPFLPSLGSANIFENFNAWRRTMSDIRKHDGNYNEE